MKNSRKVVLATLLAFVMLFSSFAVLNVSATPDDDDVEPIANLYYFNDYYPTVPKSQMDEEYPDISSVYDHKWIDGEDFDIMVANNYFESIADESIVVIDIKAFLPNTSTLYNLFSSLKDRGCMTIFVTIYDEEAYDDTSFMDYVDEYVVSEFQRLRNFLRHYVFKIIYSNLLSNSTSTTPLNNTAILIDGRLIGLDEDYDFNFDDACTNSPFFRILLEEFAGHITGGNNMSYSQIFSELAEMNISFYVHAGNNEYVNLWLEELYEVENFEDFYSNTQDYWEHISAIGFSHLDPTFYDFLVQCQNFFHEYDSSVPPVGVLEVEPFIPGPSPLIFFTDRDLIEGFHEEYFKEWDIFFVALDNIIHEILLS